MINHLNKIILIGIVFNSSVTYSQFYVKPEIGISRANNYSNYIPRETIDINGAKSSIKPSYGINFGYNFNNRLSLGLDLSRNNYIFAKAHPSQLDGIYSNEEVKITTNSYLVNLYYNFINNDYYKSHFLFGLGVASNKSSDFIHHVPYENYIALIPGKTLTNFVWQTGADLELIFNERISFNFLLKYFDYGKTITKDKLFVIGEKIEPPYDPIPDLVTDKFLGKVKKESEGPMGTKLNGISFLLGIKIYL